MPMSNFQCLPLGFWQSTYHQRIGVIHPAFDFPLWNAAIHSQRIPVLLVHVITRLDRWGNVSENQGLVWVTFQIHVYASPAFCQRGKHLPLHFYDRHPGAEGVVLKRLRFAEQVLPELPGV